MRTQSTKFFQRIIRRQDMTCYYTHSSTLLSGEIEGWVCESVDVLLSPRDTFKGIKRDLERSKDRHIPRT